MAKLAVVTGASGGIGLELSKILARDGYDLVLAARSEEQLARISEDLHQQYGINATYVAVDLIEEEGRRKLMDSVTEPVDVLINNAGFGDYGPFANSDWEKQDRMIRLNTLALAELTHHFVKGMIDRKEGKILNIASIAGFVPGPLLSAYSATKAFVLSLTEAISVELKGTGVTVTALCPGPVNTGFSKAANAESSKLFKESSGANATDVAEYGYRMMVKGKVVAVHGALFKAGTFAVRLLPRSAVRKIVYKMGKGTQ